MIGLLLEVWLELRTMAQMLKCSNNRRKRHDA